MYGETAPAPLLKAPVDVKKLPFPMVSAPFSNTIVKEADLTPRQKAYIDDYRKYGYVLVDDAIADEKLASRAISDAQNQLGRGNNRLQDGWRQSEAILSIATNELILDVLRVLYGREPIPFQTLNFIRGTEQKTHSDVIHFSSLPTGFMCGVWTALEDVTVTQGPLHYYPGSHILPEFDYHDLGLMEELVYPENPYLGEPNWDNPRTVEKYKYYEEIVERLMLEHGFHRTALELKRGQSLIWASNLFHGGNPILESATTRKSQVTHFHFEGTIPWTPMFSNATLGEYYLPSLVNLRTGQPFERSFNSMPIELTPLGRTNCYKIALADSRNTSQSQPATSVRGYYEETRRLNEELDFYRAENEKLRHTLEQMQQTRLWKAMHPIRQLAHRIRNKR